MKDRKKSLLHLTRREFLQLTATEIAAAILAACTPAQTPTPEAETAKPQTITTAPTTSVPIYVSTEAPTVQASSTAVAVIETPKPQITPSLEVGVASNKPTIIEGLTLPEGVSPAIKKSVFEAANPGCVLFVPPGESEQRQSQLMDPKAEKGKQYRGGYIAEDVLDEIFQLESDKSGKKTSKDGVQQIAPLTYIDRSGKVLIPATVAGYPVLYMEKGEMMFGSVGPDNKIQYSFPAFLSPGELAKQRGYTDSPTDTVMALRMETLGDGESLSGRLEIISGIKGEVMKTEMRFIGSKTSEKSPIGMTDWNLPIPRNVAESLKYSQVPKTFENKALKDSGQSTGFHGFKFMWGDFHKEKFNITTKEKEVLGTALGWAIAYYYDNDGNPVSEIVPTVIKLPDNRVVQAGFSVFLPWDNSTGWEGLKAKFPDHYNRITGSDNKYGSLSTTMLPPTPVNVDESFKTSTTPSYAWYGWVQGPYQKSWISEFNTIFNGSKPDLDVLVNFVTQ